MGSSPTTGTNLEPERILRSGFFICGGREPTQNCVIGNTKENSKFSLIGKPPQAIAGVLTPSSPTTGTNLEPERILRSGFFICGGREPTQNCIDLSMDNNGNFIYNKNKFITESFSILYICSSALNVGTAFIFTCSKLIKLNLMYCTIT